VETASVDGRDHARPPFCFALEKIDRGTVVPHPAVRCAPGFLLRSHTEGTEDTEEKHEDGFLFYRFPSFTVHSEFYCLPHAEGAEDAEKRMRVAFSASSISPRPAA
jgi:hypothetical protein